MKTCRNRCGCNLPVSTVITSAYRGWTGKWNGDLVALAEEAAFDVMVTSGSRPELSQDMKGRKLALVALSTPNKTRVLAAEIGGYTFVEIGH